VMASAGILAPRFLIPASGGVLLAAGFGIGAVARERRWVAVALAVVAAAMPLRASFDRLPPLLKPSPRDAGLDWIEANLPSGSRILETRAYADPGLRAQLLGVDPRRYETLFRSSAQGGLRLLAPHMDLVITGPEGGIRWSQDLRAVFKAEGVGSHGFVLKVPARRARPRYRRLTAQGLSLDASANRDGLVALLDGDRDTVWTSSRSVAPGDWIEVHLEKPQPIARLELWVGQRPSREPQLEILAIDADRNLNARFAVAARAPVERQPAAVGRPSQVFLLEPELVTGLRIRITDAAPEPWSLADLELFVRVPATPTP